MADGTTISAGSGGDTIATDEIASGVAAGHKVQRIKAGFGSDNSYSDVAAGNPLPVTDGPADTSTVTQVTSSATNTTLKTANASRRGLYIFNDSASILYVKLGATASLTSYTVQVPSLGLYELPTRPGYTGTVDGFWAAANGSALVTELTGRV